MKTLFFNCLGTKEKQNLIRGTGPFRTSITCIKGRMHADLNVDSKILIVIFFCLGRSRTTGIVVIFIDELYFYIVCLFLCLFYHFLFVFNCNFF